LRYNSWKWNKSKDKIEWVKKEWIVCELRMSASKQSRSAFEARLTSSGHQICFFCGLSWIISTRSPIWGGARRWWGLVCSQQLFFLLLSFTWFSCIALLIFFYISFAFYFFNYYFFFCLILKFWLFVQFNPS